VLLLAAAGISGLALLAAIPGVTSNAHAGAFCGANGVCLFSDVDFRGDKVTFTCNRPPGTYVSWDSPRGSRPSRGAA
jgi:hypothetical protein